MISQHFGYDFLTVKAVRCAPAWAPALQTLGRAQLNYGEPVLARASLERALAAAPADADIQADLERVHRILQTLGPEGVSRRATTVDGAGTADNTDDTELAGEHSRSVMGSEPET